MTTPGGLQSGGTPVVVSPASASGEADGSTTLSSPGSQVWLFASLPALVYATVSRSTSGAALSAAVTWPDGTAGTYTAAVLSTAFPGAVDAYSVTYGTHSVTQPQVTRDTSGAVTAQPALAYA